MKLSHEQLLSYLTTNEKVGNDDGLNGGMAGRDPHSLS